MVKQPLKSKLSCFGYFSDLTKSNKNEVRVNIARNLFTLTPPPSPCFDNCKLAHFFTIICHVNNCMFMFSISILNDSLDLIFVALPQLKTPTHF